MQKIGSVFIPIPKKKNQYLLKKKNMIYYFIAFNLCLDVSRKREKGKKKEKKTRKQTSTNQA